MGNGIAYQASINLGTVPYKWFIRISATSSVITFDKPMLTIPGQRLESKVVQVTGVNTGQVSYLMNVIRMFLRPARLGDPKPLIKLAHCRRILPRLPNIRRELCTRRPIIRKQVLQMLAHRRKFVCVSQRPIRTLENFLHLAMHSIIHLGSMRVPIRTEEGWIGRGAGGGSFDEEERDAKDCADDEHQFSDRQHRGPGRPFARGVGRRGGRHRGSPGGRFAERPVRGGSSLALLEWQIRGVRSRLSKANAPLVVMAREGGAHQRTLES
jgi:hypothetical protein